MRTIGVVTVARSDYGIYLPLLRAIQADANLGLHLLVSGAHLSPKYGLTVRTIEADGFKIGDRIDLELTSDAPVDIARAIGRGVIGFARSFDQFKPDILVVLGDRYDMYPAALAALSFKIPVAHIHGGELTRGAIDDAIRHSMTKLSHLHFVSTSEYARRVIQLGEEPWRVTVTGAPGLDNLASVKLLDRVELEEKYNLRLNRPPLLVTYHPVTLEAEQTGYQIDELLLALDAIGMPVVFTSPNADAGNQLICQKIGTYVSQHPDSWLIENLGTVDYFSLMSCAAAMVGNSSSGIIEAASFKLPVINIGTRQEGRLHGSNVIDVNYSHEDVLEGIRKVTSPAFRSSLAGLVNPYGTGNAAGVIKKRLSDVVIDGRLLKKKFYDLPDTPAIDEVNRV